MTMTTVRACEVEGCTGEHVARGFCSKHYQRWQHHGDPNGRQFPEVCTIDGCDRDADSRGWCRKHYSNWNRTGNPLSGPEQRTLRLLDVLTLDGGWLSTAGVQLLVPDLNEWTVIYALERLERDGRVASRRIELGVQDGWVDRVDYRTEWRVP